MANLNTTSLITNKPGIIKMSQFASIQSAVPKFFNHPHSVATQRAAGCIAIGFGILYLVKQASDSFFKSDENPSAPIAGKDASSLASSRNFSLITSRDVPSSSYGLNPPKVSYKRKDLFRFIITLVAHLSPEDRQKIIQLCLQYCLQLNAKTGSIPFSSPKRESALLLDKPACVSEAEDLSLVSVQTTIPEEIVDRVEDNKLSILALLNKMNRAMLPPSFMRRALALIKESPVVSGREDILIRGLKVYDIPPQNILELLLSLLT